MAAEFTERSGTRFTGTFSMDSSSSNDILARDSGDFALDSSRQRPSVSHNLSEAISTRDRINTLDVSSSEYLVLTSSSGNVCPILACARIARASSFARCSFSFRKSPFIRGSEEQSKESSYTSSRIGLISRGTISVFLPQNERSDLYRTNGSYTAASGTRWHPTPPHCARRG